MLCNSSHFFFLKTKAALVYRNVFSCFVLLRLFLNEVSLNEYVDEQEFNSISGPRSTLISSYGRRNVSFGSQRRSVRLSVVSCAVCEVFQPFSFRDFSYLLFAWTPNY